jgi:DcuC family C4-dicarboxylate transporter
MTALLSLVVIVVVVGAIMRRAEVRLTLLLGALALGALAGRPLVIVQSFLDYFTREQFLLPIGCCVGFAYVLRHTGCDEHLVQLLVRPLRGVRPLLIPGVVLVGVLVNVPVISQAATAVVIGSVLVPVLRAARISPVTCGSALLLGASLGGELLNPGAPEFRTITNELNSRLKEHPDAPEVRAIDCVAHTGRLLLVHLAVTVPLFWWLCARAEARQAPAPKPEVKEAEQPPFRINLLKALVPLLPLALLFLTALPPPLRALTVPREWLVPGKRGSFDSRLIGAAMLIGVVAAALTDLHKAKGVALAFFQGAGYAFSNVVSIIVCANCFGEGVKESGLAAHLERAIAIIPHLLFPTAAVLPAGFAWVCGSGMASTQSVYRFFVPSAESMGQDPLEVGAVVSLAAAAGRTLSPVAAVVLLCAQMTATEPLALVRRAALPVLAGMSAVVAAAMLLSA